MDPRCNEEAQNHLKFLAENYPVPKEFSVEGVRQRTANVHGRINEKYLGTFKGTEEERNIRVDENTEIPITIYTPVDVKKDKMVIFFHGGGWTACSRKTHQTIVNMMADATKTIWISVEYRLAPEYKFPIWFEDGCEVTRQIVANKTAYGGDENTKVGVAGDSAGGCIAASVCHALKNLDFQILVYGAFDFASGKASHREFNGRQYLMTPEIIVWFRETALRDENDVKDPRASALLNESFDGIPPCLFIVAELDPVRDDSYEYKKKLDAAGIKNKLVLIKGALHTFFGLPGMYEKGCGEAIEAVKQFLDDL